MKPLAERLKPKTLRDFVGQKHLIGDQGVLLPFIKGKRLFSFILWGPPGTGKTSLVNVLRNELNAEFFTLSAVDSSLKEVKEVVKKAEKLRSFNKVCILFIDEIHRFNKAQQSFLLPFVEKGTIVLIGATTENPSFEVISPLLSRVKVFKTLPLSEEELSIILKKASNEVSKDFPNLTIKEEVLKKIARACCGDARAALNTLELVVSFAEAKGLKEVSEESIPEEVFFQALPYDKSGEEHYNLISAFHKSMRGSDPDATIYWMVRMLSAGEDPLYIARRIITCAAEDVGLADPMALVIAVSAAQAFERLGSPEGEIALAEAAIYVASAPKSNSAYLALKRAGEVISKTRPYSVPLHLRNPVTKLMKELGYGRGYKYAHDYPGGFVFQNYLPEELKDLRLYEPTERGIEKKIKDRLNSIWKGKKGF